VKTFIAGSPLLSRLTRWCEAQTVSDAAELHVSAPVSHVRPGLDPSRQLWEMACHSNLGRGGFPGSQVVAIGSLRCGHFLTIGNQDLRNAAEIPKIANTGKGIERGAIRATCAVERRGSTGRENMQLTRRPMGLGLRAGM
jgi:hypothetical protein